MTKKKPPTSANLHKRGLQIKGGLPDWMETLFPEEEQAADIPYWQGTIEAVSDGRLRDSVLVMPVSTLMQSESGLVVPGEFTLSNVLIFPPEDFEANPQLGLLHVRKLRARVTTAIYASFGLVRPVKVSGLWTLEPMTV